MDQLKTFCNLYQSSNEMIIVDTSNTSTTPDSSATSNTPDTSATPNTPDTTFYAKQTVSTPQSIHETMVYEQIVEKITTLVKSTQRTYEEALASKDSDWVHQVVTQLSVLKTVCNLLGIEYGEIDKSPSYCPNIKQIFNKVTRSNNHLELYVEKNS